MHPLLLFYCLPLVPFRRAPDGAVILLNIAAAAQMLQKRRAAAHDVASSCTDVKGESGGDNYNLVCYRNVFRENGTLSGES